MLENIKAIKILGLSEKIFSVIQVLQYTEIATSAMFRKLLVGTIILCLYSSLDFRGIQLIKCGFHEQLTYPLI